MISVMQRMHSGSLALDYQAPKSRLQIFGLVRPLIGAVLAMVVFGILAADQIPAIQIPEASGAQFAFVGVLGFISGFNERFAQDFVSRASEGLGGQTSAGAGQPRPA
jgi:hypothetical protein